jgi:uncharacterized membrane protein
MTTTQVGRPGHSPRSSRRSWPVPLGLVVLSLIPLAAGAFRLVELLGGPVLIPTDQRFTTSPWPVVLHILGAATYALVGAFQFVPRFRARHLDWHRRAGRVTAVAGLVVAASAVWMTLFYATQPGTGPLLHALRLLFGPAMVACLVLGITSVRRGDIRAHRAWMIRGYAIAIAAGTQAFTQGIGTALLGPGALHVDLSLGAAWVINLGIAEWVIRRPARRSASLRRDSSTRRSAPEEVVS